jgi:hypothetical protein
MFARTTAILGLSVQGGERASFTTNAVNIRSDSSYSWSATTDPSAGVDVSLVRDAANTLALRNGANAQVFRQYASFTDTSNYERFSHISAAGITTLACESAGTGGANLDLALSPKGTGRVKVLTPLVTAVDGGLTAAFTANMVGSTGGPVTAAQNGWMLFKDSGGNNVWVPVWK